jgi:hypothetical protein
VDAVVWVLDPEKYADAVVHDDFIKPLHKYGDQMLFVLNKADRLNGSAPLVVESLRLHLMADGYQDPQIVTTVAAGSEATDLAVDQLETALAQRFDVKQAAINRLASDVGIEANRLWKILSESTVDARSLDSALAMASLVSLGVTAAEVRHVRTEGTAG